MTFCFSQSETGIPHGGHVFFIRKLYKGLCINACQILFEAKRLEEKIYFMFQEFETRIFHGDHFLVNLRRTQKRYTGSYIDVSGRILSHLAKGFTGDLFFYKCMY